MENADDWSRPALTHVATLHDKIVDMEAVEGGVIATLQDGSRINVQTDGTTPTLIDAPGGIN